jgi:hypothetical protein
MVMGLAFSIQESLSFSESKPYKKDASAANVNQRKGGIRSEWAFLSSEREIQQLGSAARHPTRSVGVPDD